MDAGIAPGPLSDTSNSTSNHHATNAQSETLLAQDPDRPYAYAEVHAQRRGQGQEAETEFHVEWAGFPAKKEWEWIAELKLKSTDGKWLCSNAMARFVASQKKTCIQWKLSPAALGRVIVAVSPLHVLTLLLCAHFLVAKLPHVSAAAG